MNRIPTFVSEMSTNKKGQIVLKQKSLFSFFHRGVPFMVQLSHNHDDDAMGLLPNTLYNVRTSCFVGFLPSTLDGGTARRNKILSLIYRSNYQDNLRFYVNQYQMIIAVCNQPIKAEDALDVQNILQAVLLSYEQVFPFIDLFLKYVLSPTPASKRYQT